MSNLAQIKSDFHSYIISVPKELTKELITIDRAERFFLLPYEAIDRYYDEKTGFKRIQEDKTWIL